MLVMYSHKRIIGVCPDYFSIFMVCKFVIMSLFFCCIICNVLYVAMLEGYLEVVEKNGTMCMVQEIHFVAIK